MVQSRRIRSSGVPAYDAGVQQPGQRRQVWHVGWNYLVGPPLRNLDFGVSNDFKLHERMTLGFSMTMANALNHPSFNTPNANISTPSSVGVISSIRGALLGEPASRNIDFILRLIF